MIEFSSTPQSKVSPFNCVACSAPRAPNANGNAHDKKLKTWSSRKSNDTIVDAHISKRSKISKEDADADSESKIYERNKNRSFMDLIQSLDLSKITQNYISVEIITTI